MHNLEHGYTILWYDETIADDNGAIDEIRGDRRQVRAAPRTSATSSSPRPWTSDDEDGETFPDGQHVAFTHWSAGGDGRDRHRASRSASSSTAPTLSGAALEHVHDEVPLHSTPPSPTRYVSPAGARASGQVASAGLLQRGHDLLDLLGARPGGDQQRVRGVDDDDVVEADDGDDPARRAGTTRPVVSTARTERRRRRARSVAAPSAAEQRRPASRSRRCRPSRTTTGTTATRPASAAGSATAWSSAIFGSVGHSSSSRAGSAAIARRVGGELRVPPAPAGRAARVGPDHEHAGVPAVAAGREVVRGGRRPTASRRTRARRGRPAWPGSSSPTWM